MKKIVEAEARAGYLLWIRFEDGTEGEVDLRDLVGKGVFESWQDPRKFRNVRVDPETHTVAWPDGVELCPDSLYRDVAGARSA